MPGHERGEFWPPEKSAPSLDLRARAATQAVIAVAIVLLAVWVARDFLVALTWAATIHACDRSRFAFTHHRDGASACAGQRGLRPRAQSPAREWGRGPGLPYPTAGRR